MTKEEYQRELESIQRWLDKKTGDLFEKWDELDFTNRHIAAGLCALAELITIKELYCLSQKENRDNNDNSHNT